MWMGGENSGTNLIANNGVEENVDDVVVGGGGLTSFKSMLEVENEWYNNMNEGQETIVFNPPNLDSSSSCSPSPSVFTSTNLDPSHISYLFPQKHNLFGNPLPQSLNLGGNNNGFFQEVQNNNHHQMTELMNRGGNGGVLGGGFSNFSPQNEMHSPSFGANSQFSSAHLVDLGGVDAGFGVADGSKFRAFEENLMSSSLFMNRGSKLLKPLDNSAPDGAQPTLFQKRAALRKNFGSSSGLGPSVGRGDDEKLESGGVNEKKRKFSNVGGLDSVSFDGSGFNYDSDDFTDNATTQNISTGNIKGATNGGANSNANSTVTGNGKGDTKGKKKGLPAKNLMAERRRRKKLNDRLYMLRSVVPKISKMDRASILGDAIEYLKELLQKINDLHNELEACPPASALTQAANINPLTPTLPNLPSRIKEELCPSSLPSPNGQPARIEVRLREGKAVNIHMFCSRRPGLLLSTMRALDGLGLDIQQAVISCFNGFAMDIFRAEQCKEGEEVHPEQIKALLLDLATFHGSSIGNCNM